MPTTIISPLVRSPDEHAIVVMPDDQTAQKIVAVQGQLKSLFGNAILLTPPQALHITLMEIICDTEYTGMSRKEYFMRWYSRYNDSAREIISKFQPIDAKFNELHVSPAAIIIKAANSEPFNTIRGVLLESTALPPQTKMPPDIAHCTIARYNKEVDVDSVRELAEALPIDIDIHINEFKLMKDLGPDFRPAALQTYSLRV